MIFGWRHGFDAGKVRKTGHQAGSLPGHSMKVGPWRIGSPMAASTRSALRPARSPTSKRDPGSRLHDGCPPPHGRDARGCRATRTGGPGRCGPRCRRVPPPPRRSRTPARPPGTAWWTAPRGGARGWSARCWSSQPFLSSSLLTRPISPASRVRAGATRSDAETSPRRCFGRVRSPRCGIRGPGLGRGVCRR